MGVDAEGERLLFIKNSSIKQKGMLGKLRVFRKK